jgi:class 3 adenylate cyclase/tetratricopeptide (TPR) repeat protein
MQCPRCQRENPPQAKFCLECGARVALTCTKCRSELPAGAKFCLECGEPVASQAATEPRFTSPEAYTPKHLAEKILTSKTALKGSMELLADRDPEEARKILDPVLERMMEAVHRYEGTVNQVMGDGIMALFGAPLAHEDHAVRACYAALRMQESVKRYADEVHRTAGVPLHIRVGLNSGEVVVRAIGSDLHMDYTAVGQTTHLASRLEQMAMPGSILIAPETLTLAEGYVVVKPLGPRPVKGLDAPVEVYEVLGAGMTQSRLKAAAARGFTRFIGRDDEMSTLTRAAVEARSGHGQLVAVVGEPGVGKSRLLYEFMHSHHAHGVRVLESTSVSYGKTTAYLPISDLLRSYFHIDSSDDVRAIRAKVTGTLLTLDEALKETIPPILRLLDALSDDSPFLALDPVDRRRRTLAAVKAVLLRESRVQPLLVVFEDLHWIDSETQTFLDGLVESLPAVPILLAVNYRPEYRHAWGSKTYYRQLRIDALPPESADELLDSLLGSDASLRPLKPLLIARTEGNPLFLEETARTLVEIGVLVGSRGAYQLVKPLETISVPPTVQAILAARIDRLGGEDKRLLQAASVIGKNVPYALLLAIADLDEDGLRRGLARLQATEFLYEARLFPDPEYTFKHALTCEIAYGSLLSDRRRALHGALVRAIERLHADRLDEHVEELANHARRSALHDEAVRYLYQAGNRAAARSAHLEASALFEQALTVLGELPETPDTLSAAVDVRIAQATALMAIRGAASSEVETLVLHMHDLALRLGDAGRLFAALWALWLFTNSSGRYREALELAKRLLAVAEANGDSSRLLEAHHALWTTMGAMGEAAAAIPHCERGVALYDPARHTPQTSVYAGHDPGVCCRYQLALAHWFLGYPERAAGIIQDALGLAEKLAHAPTMIFTLSTTAFLRYQIGDHDAARESAERMIALARAHERMPWIDNGLVILACVEARQRGDYRRLNELSERLSARGSGEPAWRRVINLALLAGCLSEVGDVEKGLTALEAIPLEHRDLILAPEVRRVHGELLLRLNEREHSERQLHEAIEMARRRSERIHELRATASLARLWREQGKLPEAHQMLAESYGWFTEGFETADLRNARTLLNELSAASS